VRLPLTSIPLLTNRHGTVHASGTDVDQLATNENSLRTAAPSRHWQFRVATHDGSVKVYRSRVSRPGAGHGGEGITDRTQQFGARTGICATTRLFGEPRCVPHQPSYVVQLYGHRRPARGVTSELGSASKRGGLTITDGAAAGRTAAGGPAARCRRTSDRTRGRRSSPRGPLLARQPGGWRYPAGSARPDHPATRTCPTGTRSTAPECLATHQSHDADQRIAAGPRSARVPWPRHSPIQAPPRAVALLTANEAKLTG
jgi:hypothetical protein